ncbi:hypothetical protein Tco_0944997 [Tanacetum coccineum]
MAAYLEKTDGNAEFHEIIDFLTRNSIHYALIERNVTPLFESMLVQPTEDESEAGERQSKPQPTPSPPHPKGSGGNHRGQSSSDRSLSGNEDGLTLQSVYDLCVSLCKQVTNQAKEIQHLKAQIKKLKKKAKPVITHHKAWMKSGRKPAKSEPTVHKDPAFDDLDDVMDYMEIDAYMQKGVSTELEVSTVKPDEGTVKPKVSTDKPEVSTAKPKEVEVSTDKLDEGTAKPKDGTSDESTAPTTVFRDDETIAEFLVSMSQNKAKQKGVEIKDAEDSDRPRATSTRSVLTLKPLPKIDPKDKGKKVLEEEAESDAESEGVDEAERKFDQLAKDEEIARKVQEDWEAEEEMKKLAEEEATKAALIQDFDDIQARIEADRLLAARLQEEERETIIRLQLKREPNFFMILLLLKGGGKKHVDLKNKNFEEIQVLYKKVKRSDKDFIAIGSAEDERQIKEMNEESKDPKKKRVVNETPREEDTAKVPAEQEVTEQGTKKRKSVHVKMIARKRPRPKPDDDSDDEHRKCLRIVTFDSTLDSEIMETKSFISKLHKVSSPDGDYLVVYRVRGHFRAFNYLLEVLHIFDRQDLFHLYDLVMKQYLEISLEVIKLILWGDLKIMMESSIEENDQGDFWNNQQDWEIFRWRLYEACEVCILELKDGTVIYMLVERRYPLSMELLQRMLDLGLEVEEESTVALHLVRFIMTTQLNEENAMNGCVKIWLSIHLVVYNEELAILEQTATGKGISNPLMAGSLPKITKPTYIILGLQVQQKKDGIFISQDKYVVEILKKFGFTEVKTASTPMETQKPLLKDEDGEEVDVHMYRSMIGSLMYLTSSRPDIMFAVCACARYQVNPKVSHLHAVKMIFRLISWQCKKQTVVVNSTTEVEYVAASSCCGQLYLILLGKAKKSVRLMMEKLFGMELELILVTQNEAVHKELGDRLLRAATTASSLESEQDSGGGPRCQETMGDTIAQTRFENVSKLSNDSLLARDEYITLVNVQYDADNEIFDVDALTGDEVFVVEHEVAAKDVNLTVDEVTLAQALAALKSVKPKVKGDVIKEPSVPVSVASASTKVSAATTITATIPTPRK